MPPDLDVHALRNGSRDLAALAERCRALAAELDGRGHALTGGPGSWTGAAARASGGRTGALVAALGQAATTTTEAAGVLATVAGAAEDAEATWRSAERLAARAGVAVHAAGVLEAVGPGGGPAHAAVARAVQVLAGEADGRVRAATTAAAAAFDELAARAPALCQGIDRRGPFARALEARTGGPVSAWADVRDGLVSGVKDLVGGGVQTALLVSPFSWALRPAATYRRAGQVVRGGLDALRDPAAAVRYGLGTDDLGNGHAWRFWARLAPQAALAVATRGAGSLARAAGAGEEAAAAADGLVRLPPRAPASLSLEPATRIAEIAEGRPVPLGSAPLGFGRPADFRRFGTLLGQGLREAGYGDVRAAFQGSSVTGRKYLSGAPFDLGRASGFDIALGTVARSYVMP